MMESTTNAKYSAWSPVFVRAAFGIVFLVSGAGKILGIGPKSTGGVGGFVGFLTQLGVPAPELFAWIVGLVELLGGLLILLGLFTRYAAVLIAIDMAVATWLVHVPNGFDVANGGYEYTLALGLIAIALVLSGPGALSLEQAIYGRERLPTRRKRTTSEQRKSRT